MSRITSWNSVWILLTWASSHFHEASVLAIIFFSPVLGFFIISSFYSLEFLPSRFVFSILCKVFEQLSFHILSFTGLHAATVASRALGFLLVAARFIVHLFGDNVITRFNQKTRCAFFLRQGCFQRPKSMPDKRFPDGKSYPWPTVVRFIFTIHAPCY